MSSERKVSADDSAAARTSEVAVRPIVFPETELYFKPEGVLYRKESGRILEYIINECFADCCKIRSRNAVNGATQLVTVCADDIGKTVFFRKTDCNIPMERLREDELYSNYINSSDIATNYYILKQKAKDYETDINLTDSKRKELALLFVFDKNMRSNERYIAYTRALSSLSIVRK